MGDTGFGKRLYEVKKALEEIEQELAVSESGMAALEDFKMAVDHVRLSVWAILSAEQPKEIRGLPPSDARELIAQFRVSRVIEICHHLMKDIDSGLTSASSLEISRLRSTLEEAHERVAALID
jgi:glyoxylate carboligase